MVDSVSFKVYCQKRDRQDIRRFCLGKDLSSSFSYLQKKLFDFYPEIRTFSLLWTDEEGDLILVSNDEDLKIALAEMKGPLFKFVMKPVEKDNSKNQGIIHPGVMCDGCQGKVVGFRYKCLVCEDFDLCGECEFSGLHPQHSMIRIIDPQIAWPQQVFSPLRILNQCNEVFKEENKKNDRDKIPSTVESVIGPVFEMMVKSSASEETKSEKENNLKPKLNESSQPMRSIEGELKLEKSSTKLPQPTQVSQASENMGESKENSNKKIDKNDNATCIQSSLDQNDDGESIEMEENIDNEKVTSIEPEKEKNTSTASLLQADNDEWTVVTNDSVEKEETSQNLTEVLSTTPKGELYPCLPENNSKSVKVQVEHPNPKINVALQAMLNMGFTNDGGWLTNLLEAKQGDIGETLDVLKPSRD